MADAKTTEYCSRHAQDGIINVKSRKYKTESCRKRPSFGVAGTKTAEYCAQNAVDKVVDIKNMVDVRSRKCRTEAAASNRRSE